MQTRLTFHNQSLLKNFYARSALKNLRKVWLIRIRFLIAIVIVTKIFQAKSG